MDINKRIGDYEILEELGRGGMGRVYRVRNVISDRVEAMKVLLPDLVSQPELESRFLREIKMLAAMEHPNIATLRTAMKDGNQVVMIMEFVDGETLSQRIKRGPVPMDEALAHIDQVLEALSYAHARGVIHRDIKPANMMLTSDGLVKLTDFGIARSQNDATLTAAGTTTGSLSYMSPEQVNAEPTDARSDLYSVGISLYEMVTGQRPFQADSDFAVMVAHLKEMPRPPIELAPQLGSELNAVIMKAIAKGPADRYQTADEFRTALTTVPAFPTAVGEAPIAVPPPTLSDAVTIAKTGAVPRTGTVTPISPERVRSLMDVPAPALAAAAVPPVPLDPAGAAAGHAQAGQRRALHGDRRRVRDWRARGCGPVLQFDEVGIRGDGGDVCHRSSRDANGAGTRVKSGARCRHTGHECRTGCVLGIGGHGFSPRDDSPRDDSRRSARCGGAREFGRGRSSVSTRRRRRSRTRPASQPHDEQQPARTPRPPAPPQQRRRPQPHPANPSNRPSTSTSWKWNSISSPRAWSRSIRRSTTCGASRHARASGCGQT